MQFIYIYLQKSFHISHSHSADQYSNWLLISLHVTNNWMLPHLYITFLTFAPGSINVTQIYLVKLNFIQSNLDHFHALTLGGRFSWVGSPTFSLYMLNRHGKSLWHEFMAWANRASLFKVKDLTSSILWNWN